MSLFFRIILLTVIIADLLILGGIFYVEQGTGRALEPASSRTQMIEIEQGMGLRQIARLLEDEGIIKDDIFFLYHVWSQDEARALQAGTYMLGPAMTVREIAEIIVGGNVESSTVRLTIPEGYTLRDIERRLRTGGAELQEGEFIAAAGVRAELAEEIFPYVFIQDIPKRASLEGYLFPDTYEFEGDENVTNIIKKMLATFEIKVMPLWEARYENHPLSLHETMTLAALLEKEVQTFQDMRAAAGVLMKRLDAGMPLQVDATLAYLTGKKTGEILNTDKLIDSPYNTYKYAGLPPGPIVNPGLNSIKAALDPQQNDFWYYLSAPDGKTVFSKTLEEHNINKAEFLR